MFTLDGPIILIIVAGKAKGGLDIPPFLRAALLSYPLSFEDVIPLLRRCLGLIISSCLWCRRILTQQGGDFDFQFYSLLKP